MKVQWTNFSNTFADFNYTITDFVDGVQDARTKRALKKLLEKWNKVVIQQNEFDKLVEPIKPRSISMPFPGTEFAEMWVTYKEYLMEDHAGYIGSRRETIMLKRLKKLANDNERRAIEMLEYFISSGYKSIFKPSEKQLTGEEPSKAEQEQSIDISKTATPL